MKQEFYDGLLFHRVINDFLLQTGDPGSDSLVNVQARKETLAAMLRRDTPRYTIPEPHREVYKSIGGTAPLDQNYTVFGEVISGMDVVDSIAAVPTDGRDRPLEDVRILTARLVRRR